MDHKEQHHQHHQKEREHKIEHEKERERMEEKAPRRFHPAWFVVLGAVMIALVIATWTFLL